MAVILADKPRLEKLTDLSRKSAGGPTTALSTSPNTISTEPTSPKGPFWTRQFGTPDEEEAGGTAVVDEAGNLYVVGTTFGTFPGQSKGKCQLVSFGATPDFSIRVITVKTDLYPRSRFSLQALPSMLRY